MAGDQGNVDERRLAEIRLMASFIEMLSADACVVVYTWTQEKKTKARLVSWGNLFATRGLVEWAYTETFPEDEDEITEEEDDDDE